MQNASLDESQAEVKIAGRNNNLGYADDTTVMAESEEGLKSLLIRVKGESEKAETKLSIHNIKIMASTPITSCQIEEGKVEAVIDFIFLDSKSIKNGDCGCDIKRCLLHGRKAMTNLDSLLKSKDITLLTSVQFSHSVVSDSLWPHE